MSETELARQELGLVKAYLDELRNGPDIPTLGNIALFIDCRLALLRAATKGRQAKRAASTVGAKRKKRTNKLASSTLLAEVRT